MHVCMYVGMARVSACGVEGKICQYTPLAQVLAKHFSITSHAHSYMHAHTHADVTCMHTQMHVRRCEEVCLARYAHALI